MSALEKLAECAGGWTGTNRVSDPSMNVSDDSPSTAELTPLLGGKFFRLDYTWAYEAPRRRGRYSSDTNRLQRLSRLIGWIPGIWVKP